MAFLLNVCNFVFYLLDKKKDIAVYFYCQLYKTFFCMRTGFYCFFTLIFLVSKSFAQVQPAKNLSDKDSIDLENQLKNLLGTDEKSVSYFYANLGWGNRLYNSSNKSLNANQGAASTVVYSPSLSYYNKTGLGISAGANLFNDSKQFGINQYSITPSFDLLGNKDVSFGISFTHYFVKDKYSAISSSVDNDLFTSIGYKRSWLKPSISLGYSSGEYGEAKNKDTLIGGVKRYFYDTLIYKSNSFYTMFSVEHEFLLTAVFDKSDALSFSPSLIVNAGAGSNTISHFTNVPPSSDPSGPGQVFRTVNRKNRLPRTQTSKFKVQSIGLNLNLNYSIGNFNIEPQYYLDYYIGTNSTDKTTSLFMLTLGYTF